jgi:hypothetical protein
MSTRLYAQTAHRRAGAVRIPHDTGSADHGGTWETHASEGPAALFTQAQSDHVLNPVGFNSTAVALTWDVSVRRGGRCEMMDACVSSLGGLLRWR